MAAAGRISAVERIAKAIRKDALRLQGGDLLGSEEDLLGRYKISRPTLRQAASLVAQERLILVKRGVGGGYFVSRPDAKMVSRTAALYLRIQRARLSEIWGAFRPIRIEIARLAARCEDPELRDKLQKFTEREGSLGPSVSFREFLSGERRFNMIIGQMCGNKALLLFLEILLDLASMVDREEDIYRNHPERVARLREERDRLALNILDGDEELAMVSAQRCASLSASWMTFPRKSTRNQLNSVEHDPHVEFDVGP